MLVRGVFLHQYVLKFKNFWNSDRAAEPSSCLILLYNYLLFQVNLAFTMATFSGGLPPGVGPPMNQNPSSPTQEGPGLKSFAESVKSSSGGPANIY